MLNRSVEGTGWNMDWMFRSVVIGVSHLVRSYGNLAFLWVHASDLRSTAGRSGNCTGISSASWNATGNAGSDYANIPGEFTASGCVEGGNLISIDAVTTVGGLAERSFRSTALAVIIATASHDRSWTTSFLPDVKVDSIAYCGDACNGSKKFVGEAHLYLRILGRATMCEGNEEDITVERRLEPFLSLTSIKPHPHPPSQDTRTMCIILCYAIFKQMCHQACIAYCVHMYWLIPPWAYIPSNCFRVSRDSYRLFLCKSWPVSWHYFSKFCRSDASTGKQYISRGNFCRCLSNLLYRGNCLRASQSLSMKYWQAYWNFPFGMQMICSTPSLPLYVIGLALS